jgi:lysine 2,3-aminomutase
VKLRGLRPVPVPQRVAPEDWTSWTWQMRHRIRSADELAHWLPPLAEETEAIQALADRFHFVITPYYASLMDPTNPACP